MLRLEKLGLVYYQSRKLLDVGFDNFFFTRFGGVSKGELAELNLSFRVGDDPERVRQNRDKVREVMAAEKLILVRQVHSARVIQLDSGKIDQEALANTEADGIVSEQTGIALGVLCADCFPLLLAEKKKRIVSVCHCGRRGIVAGVIENAIKAILSRGGNVENIIGAIGPGICGQCYTVDQAVISEYQKKFPQAAGKIWQSNKGDYLLDLRQAIFQVLGEAGIPGQAIDDLGLCTFQSQEFFSHRRSSGRSGRQLSAIMIK